MLVSATQPHFSAKRPSVPHYIGRFIDGKSDTGWEVGSLKNIELQLPNAGERLGAQIEKILIKRNAANEVTYAILVTTGNAVHHWAPKTLGGYPHESIQNQEVANAVRQKMHDLMGAQN